MARLHWAFGQASAYIVWLPRQGSKKSSLMGFGDLDGHSASFVVGLAFRLLNAFRNNTQSQK